jgi:hypothetical protein
LTSQIFANVYLNEFDRYVRHGLKPLGYVRYGDDFLLFARNQNEALTFQFLGTKFLNDKLRLKLHPLNNIVISVKRGLKYLGIVHYPNSRAIPSLTFKQILGKVSMANQDTYKVYVRQYGSHNQIEIMDSHIMYTFGHRLAE